MRSAEISVNAIRKKLSSQSYNCKSNPHSQIKFVFLSSVGTKTFWHEKRLIFFNQSVALAIHAISLSIPYNAVAPRGLCFSRQYPSLLFLKFQADAYSQQNPIKNFLGNIQVLRWAMSAVYSLSWESWLAYVAFIEGNFPQCGPQYIAVFGGTIPLLVRIMWALPMHYQCHFLQYTQDIIMEFLLKIHDYF